MQSILIIAAVLSGISLLPWYIWSFSSSNNLFNYIESNHPDIWGQLGKPKLLVNKGYGAESLPVRFFTQEKFLATSDPQLHALGRQAKGALYWAASAFCICLFSVLALKVGSQMGWL